MLKINRKSIAAVVLLSVLIVGVSGCKKEGPMERAGQKIDESVEKAGQQIDKGIKKSGDHIEKAEDKIKDSVK